MDGSGQPVELVQAAVWETSSAILEGQSGHRGALRDQAGTSGSDFCDGLSLAWFSSGGKQDAEPVVVEVAEASG